MATCCDREVLQKVIEDTHGESLRGLGVWMLWTTTRARDLRVYFGLLWRYACCIEWLSPKTMTIPANLAQIPCTQIQSLW